MKNTLLTLTILCAIPAMASNELEIKEKANNFSSQLISENYQEAANLFTDELLAQISVQKLKEIWGQIQQQFGLYEGKDSLRISAVGNSTLTVQPLHFVKATLDLKLGFDAEEEIASLFFAPHEETELHLVSNERFTETEITVLAQKELPLKGILTLPLANTNAPCIVLVHGSGANDMDETIGKHKLFRELAHGLAEKGIAVIRYEKRTKTYGGTPLLDAETLTLYDETIEDAKAAVKLASKQAGIDAKNIFVLGHSLGGMSAPRIAQQSKKIKGIIILAGNARPLQALVLDQFYYLFKENGVLSPEEEKMIAAYKNQLRVLEQLKNEGKAVGVLPLGLSAAYWKYLLEYDQVKTAQRLKNPILIIQGGRDYQVPPTEFNRWKEALSDHKNVSFQLYEKLNHLMLEGEGPSYPKEYEKDGNPPAYLIDGISEWIFSQKVVN